MNRRDLFLAPKVMVIYYNYSNIRHLFRSVVTPNYNDDKNNTEM